ncbi:hypothetical protein WMY93_032701 [Mugilogobius chulae]|uniref:Ig-like domain-containing protein n=1 Tax=Mugilogobius chulae TaxID=88201 RepID=A0AAW0MK30_9GOBI
MWTCDILLLLLFVTKTFESQNLSQLPVFLRLCLCPSLCCLQSLVTRRRVSERRFRLVLECRGQLSTVKSCTPRTGKSRKATDICGKESPDFGLWCVRGARSPRTSQRSMSDSQTRLPCRYQAGDGEKVVQVTWYKGLPDGTKDQMITAHFTDGHTEFGRYAGRVKFESNNPTENSALLIPTTEEFDEGTYTCHISTFPNGNFERTIGLTVWSLPISSLEPVVMREGQSFGVAASCRSMGRPAPRLSWDTSLVGQTQNRSSESGSVSSLFSIYPMRSMNGKRLDCLVWHPGFDQPRRISNTLEVQYPPEVKISAGSGHLSVGMEKAELICEAQGQPQVSNITWKWKGGALPDGAVVIQNRLSFKRALRLNDSGVYECVALNAVGPGRTEYDFTVAAVAGLLLLMMVLVIVFVNRHHRNKHKKLQLELSEKRNIHTTTLYEIHNLSRQNSLRRINSVSSEPRMQERPIYKGSQGTLTGKWGPSGGVAVDELGRPVVWGETELDSEREERRRRIESYLKNSNMSLGAGAGPESSDCNCCCSSGLRSALFSGPLKPPPEEVFVPSPNREQWSPSAASAPGQADDDSDSGSYQISEALNNHFYFSNGQLRPRPHSNAILLHPSRTGSVIRNQNS